MSTLGFTSSQRMAFPGPQRTQEIESVIVYVSAERQPQFLRLLSAGPYLTSLRAGKQNRGVHC